MVNHRALETKIIGRFRVRNAGDNWWTVLDPSSLSFILFSYY